eukprot:8375986-Heterocapsa_arctica.AAC.1
MFFHVPAWAAGEAASSSSSSRAAGRSLRHGAVHFGASHPGVVGRAPAFRCGRLVTFTALCLDCLPAPGPGLVPRY